MFLKKASTWALNVALLAALAACGGGGDDAPDGGGGGGGGSSAPGTAVTMGEPTANLTPSEQTAQALTDEAKNALNAARAAVDIPGAIALAGMPAAASTTINCQLGGTMGYEFSGDSIGQGSRVTFKYNNCSFDQGYVYDGTYVLHYDRWVNNTDFTWTATYDMLYTGPNDWSHRYESTQTCTYSGTEVTCFLSDGGRVFSSNLALDNGRLNGTYQWTYGDLGTLSYTFNNWTETSGSIEVRAATGSATIVRNGANSFTVTINGTSYTTS